MNQTDIIRESINDTSIGESSGMDRLAWVRLGIYFFTWVGGLVANFLGIIRYLLFLLFKAELSLLCFNNNDDIVLMSLYLNPGRTVAVILIGNGFDYVYGCYVK